MNIRQLEKLGVPRSSAKSAIVAVQQLAANRELSRSEVRERIRQVVQDPKLFLGDPILDGLAKDLLSEVEPVAEREPLTWKSWGDNIDEAARRQMDDACRIPSAVAAALMPDAHLGYGLPIGGVLALEDAVCPYAVGVDIACRMKISVLDMPVETITSRFEFYRAALENGTRFGVGCEHQKPQDHAVLDENWSVTRITRENKDRARRQLGTSGSGNHFVEFGVLTLTEACDDVALEPGQYVALLTHSGSRGTGAAVCSTYSDVARRLLPRKHADLGRLAWLDMNCSEGRDYWAAMNLMGDYAAANHDVIHRLVTHLLGARIVFGVENHHNFAWKEIHHGRQVVVHRKGATPADVGVLGVIPGSMADPAYVVRGRGNADSLNSASHGAGRAMSRTAAKAKFNFRSIQKTLEKRGIRVLSAGSDEVPGVYKNIEQVMSEQRDLVDIVARFDPKIVKMCGDGSRAED
ncbi:MAG TPA: RtcB family protein [Planctomycetaceae bacterium]|nr:RtcB family protein [Planctomycetaceae bacterium]